MKKMLYVIFFKKNSIIKKKFIISNGQTNSCKYHKVCLVIMEDNPLRCLFCLTILLQKNLLEMDHLQAISNGGKSAQAKPPAVSILRALSNLQQQGGKL